MTPRAQGWRNAEAELLTRVAQLGGIVRLRELNLCELHALRRLERRGALLRTMRGSYGETRGLA